MIQLHLQLQPDGQYLPILTCAHCSQQVFGNGNVLWAVDPQTRALIAGPYLTHEHCYDLFAEPLVAQWPTITWVSDSLSTFMTSLIAFSQVELGA